MIKKLLALFFILSGPGYESVAAKDMNSLYDDSALIYWEKIIPEDIQWNFDHVVKPILTDDEIEKLAAVQLVFPLKDSHPLNFYAISSPPTIAMPMSSLRFFGDLCLAYSWLWANGYSLETITHYLAMLKHREAGYFPGGRYPTPLETLGIPVNAREDPKTLDVFQKTYKSAVVFILAHELAHIYYRHPGYRPPVTLDEARWNEEQADHFALEIMRRVGAAPLGMTIFFMALAHLEHNRWDFASEENYEHYLSQHWTHPLTPTRLELLANKIREAAHEFALTQEKEGFDFDAALKGNHFVAGEIDKIAQFLNDPGLQQGIRYVGEKTDPVLLVPRRR